MFESTQTPMLVKIMLSLIMLILYFQKSASFTSNHFLLKVTGYSFNSNGLARIESGVRNILRNPHILAVSRLEESSIAMNDDIVNNTSNDAVKSSLQLSLESLRVEREKKRLEYLAADIAVKKIEREVMSKSANTTYLKGNYDYGFTSKSNGPIVDTRSSGGGFVPASALTLGIKMFQENLKDIANSFAELLKPAPLEMDDSVRQNLKKLKLSNDAIWKREESRPQINAPWIIKVPYLVLCLLLDTLFDGRPIMARMPYFSYITMLHAYETLGWWRRSTEAKRVHFAEEYNEYHHLLIMESLGGDQDWQVRFFAQHASIVYYFVLIGLWLASPTLAYNFSELIEAHAVDTYAEFAESNKDLLMQMAAPKVAKDYYEAVDMYVFDEFQTNRPKGSRRPVVNSLYDVFKNICEDEGEHVATMSACQDPNVLIKSPNTEAAIIASTISIAIVAALSSNIVLPNLGSEVEATIRDFFNSAGESLSSSTKSVVETAESAATITSQVLDEDGTKSIVEAKSAIANTAAVTDVKSLFSAIADIISKFRP